ncbi:cadherin-related tumor suppressor-like [Saccostrea echinata]|uniref:cadherin-related tumor suppressor-like n=1 Tax=Saccostrea echinata TaxID=191078 RepID=UPI002A82BF73|nr:cadherin-related tumor suppressor-like [Saccostrea echinata]
MPHQFLHKGENSVLWGQRESKHQFALKESPRLSRMFYSNICETDSFFQINASNGNISLRDGHSLDRENLSVITLVVRAYQVDKPEFRRDVTTVQINVTDVNDNPPVMSQTSYTASIPENMKNGQVVTWVKATDADEGPNAEFVYILENCNKSFEINQTGSIIVKDSTQLDMEENQQFTCTVYAKESQTAENKSSNRSSLTISLTDVNDNNPEFHNKSYSFNVTRNPSKNTIIGQVKAEDGDVSKPTNGYVTYELSGQKEKFFQINNKTGELHPISNPLYGCDVSKLPKSVESYVTASDNPKDSTTKRTTTVRVSVNIQTNLCSPVLSILENVSRHSVPEDILPGTPLVTIQVDTKLI